MRLATMGTDPHLDSITAAVVGSLSEELESVTVPNTPVGWETLVGVCHRYGVRMVGVEGASGYGRGLAQTVTAVGLSVREIPTRLTARRRRIDGAGKSDPVDARAIGRAAARGEGSEWVDAPDLETIRVLTHRRKALVEERTRNINELRALLAEIDPPRAARMGRLRSRRQFSELTQAEYHGDTHRETVAMLIRDLAEECLRCSDRIRDYEKRIKGAMPPIGEELMAQHGIGMLTAASILAEVAGSAGFETDRHFASWAGVSPLDASSGRQERHRLNRGGNRQANRAIHTMIITQHRQQGEAHQYINHRTAEGKTEREAIRAAKRYAARRIWKILKTHGLT